MNISSCTCYDTCRCMILCMTCGCCDPGKLESNKNYTQNRMTDARENRKAYSQQRSGWIANAKRLFGL